MNAVSTVDTLFDTILDEELGITEAEWIEERVGIVEFVESQQFLGLKEYIFPRILDILVEIDKPDVREAYLGLGKGSGKSYLAEILLARSSYDLLNMPHPRQTMSLAPDSPLVTLNVSVNREQAQDVVYAGFVSKLESSPWFAGKFKPYALRVKFQNNIIAICGHSRSTGWLGYNYVSGVLDEASHMFDDRNKSVAESLVDTMRDSMLTRGTVNKFYKLIVISSVDSYEDYLMRQIRYVEQHGESFELAQHSGGES